jgi:hypothetical protein
LETPSETPFSNENGTFNGTHWLSSDFLISEEGVFSYNVTCKDANGASVDAENDFTLSYTMTFSPSTFDIAALEVVSEEKNVSIYMYDDSQEEINFTINVDILNSSNFTLTYPDHIVLNSSDSSSTPLDFLLQIQADGATPQGLYSGNITLNNTILNEQHIIYFNYSINPPGAKPIITTTSGTECTSSIESDCSTQISIEQGDTNIATYNISKEGTANLTNCSIYVTNDLSGETWLAATESEFNVTNGDVEVSLIFNPQLSDSTGVYAGYMYVGCESGDTAGNPVDSDTDNRPLQIITITAPGAPGGGGGRDTIIREELNLTEELTGLGICNNNNVCEDGENPLSCPNDCAVSLDDIFCTPLFSCGVWLTSWFTALVAILILIVFGIFAYTKERTGTFDLRRLRRRRRK